MYNYIITIPVKEPLTPDTLAIKLESITKGLFSSAPSHIEHTIKMEKANEPRIEDKIIKQIEVVRDLQNKYFSSRSPVILKEAKVAERALDELLKSYKENK